LEPTQRVRVYDKALQLLSDEKKIRWARDVSADLRAMTRKNAIQLVLLEHGHFYTSLLSPFLLAAGFMQVGRRDKFDAWRHRYQSG
jgi:hypothetical protein